MQFPPNPKYIDILNVKFRRNDNRETVNREYFSSLMDDDGRISKHYELKKAIFRGNHLLIMSIMLLKPCIR